MIIRREEEKDYFEVENLTREAFFNVYRPGCFEHLVVHKLRNDKSFIKELDYVIELDNKIIASIFYARGKVVNNNIEKDTLLFGPVSVLPEYQKKGYAEKLINYTLDKARSLGYSEVFITGNPMYYKKYGFESASKYNVYYEGLPKNDEYPFFMIKILDKNKFNIDGGVYSDPDCYNVDINELDEFDKNFPYKVKEEREGQLE